MKFLDLFSGIGGFRLGLERAGHKPVGYVEIDKFARQSYQAMYDTDGEWTAEDINKVTDEEWRKFNGTVELIAGGFPCAPAGAKVKTLNGFKSIEDLTNSDFVLTHTGKYQKVVTPMNKIANHYNKIKATGVYNLKLTDEHPLYVYNTVTEKFEWVDANRLNKDIHMLTFNINQESVPTGLDEDILWLLGRYVADGYVEKDRSRTVFSVRKSKLQEFMLHATGMITYTNHKDRECVDVVINNDMLKTYALKFGRGAENKYIPDVITNAPEDEIHSFINGYLSGDGYVDETRTMWTTVSENLALGIQELFIKAYHRIPTISVRKDNRKETFRDTYNSQIRPTTRTTFVVGNYIVSKISSIERVKQEIKVYNIEVENDNSYTINNTIVHNCQSFSIAGKRQGFLDQTKGTLFFEVARAVKQVQPRFVFLENVKGLLNHDKGNTFRTILNTFDELGYDVEWRIINSKNHGVAQNRERVYIIGHLRGDSGREVFPFFREGGETNKANVKQVGNISESKSFGGNPQVGRVYSADGLSPTLNTMQGGGREPKVIVKEATKKVYDIATVGDSINISQPNSKTRRGRVGHGVANTLLTGSEQATLLFDYRIRKLTPRETWRLQAFPDELFEKAKDSGMSDSQLYKQAGNSVTVNVIEYIGGLLKEVEE